MFTHRTHLRWGAVAAVYALIWAPTGRAELAKTSPFLPPQGAGAAPTAGAPLEFRGTILTAEGMLYRVYDPARKTGSWVKMNQRDGTLEVVAKQHDPNQNTLTVEYQGKTLTLAGRESKIVSSGNAALPMPMPAPVAQPPNVAPAVTQSVVVNPTPADEQRRLEAVAAEVARRRALREQASQQMTQGAAPAAPQPVQPPTMFQPKPPQPGAKRDPGRPQR